MTEHITQAEAADKFVGKEVKVLGNRSQAATPGRPSLTLKPGDTIKIDHVGKNSNGIVLYYKVLGSEYNFINIDEVELVETNECHCKRLLIGHDPDCLWIKNKKRT